MNPLVSKGGAVYILTNKNNTVLYIGVSSNLYNRMIEHKMHQYPHGFTARYNCDKLVYYIQFSTIQEAIIHEKKLKDRSRNYKNQLINKSNPEWKDLWDNDVSKW